MVPEIYFLFVFGNLLITCHTIPSLSLREYCDDVVYRDHKSPHFGWHPRTYILGYYKRCIDHDQWVDCIVAYRKAPPAGVKVERFEVNFPRKVAMIAAGIVLCDMRLHTVRPNITSCKFNTTMCNRVYETMDKCEDSGKKATCIWGQLSKCGIEAMKPLLNYEFGLLGGFCLKQLGRAVYPYSRALEGCDGYTGSATQMSPSIGLVLTLGSWTALVSVRWLLRPAEPVGGQ